MTTRKLFARIVILAAVLVMAGCSTAAPAVVPTQAPTADLGAVKTEAAQTVVAAITAEALANPSATPTVEPSATPVPPTATPAATLTPIKTATVRASGGSTGGGGGGGGVFRPSPTYYTDRAAWVSQSLKDGVVMKPGQDFDMTWTVKNTGARDWTTDFYYAFQSGDLEPVKGDVRYLADGVGKNDTVNLLVDFIAPSQPGRYTSNWALINDDGVAFFHFYIVIYVQ